MFSFVVFLGEKLEIQEKQTISSEVLNFLVWPSFEMPAHFTVMTLYFSLDSFFSFLSWFSVNPQVQTPGESSGWGQQSCSRTRGSKQLAGEKTGNISQNLFRFLYYIFSLVACFNQPLLCLFVCNDLKYYYLQKYDKYDMQLSSFKSLKFFQSWISMWLSIVRQNGRSGTPQLVLPWSLCSSD